MNLHCPHCSKSTLSLPDSPYPSSWPPWLLQLAQHF
uniref:Uncharacterized protein n=1 Tax=Rhizophora mucronata TaxID=61149 RepID=A0A2P2NJR6_RHIMU